MPANVVRSDRDEHLWNKAKARANVEGHKGNWAYVMGIYKNMKGGHEKTAKLNAMELLTIGAPIIPASILAKNISGDTAHNLTPKGMKLKAEKTGRRVGMVGGGLLAALSAGVLLRKSPALRRILSKHLEPEAVNIAMKYGLIPSAIGIGSLGGYALGAASAAGHAMFSRKKDLEKSAKEKGRGVNWTKLLATAAVTGLVAKSLGSFAEKYLEKKFGPRISVSKLIPKWAKKPTAWAAGRGLTGAGTGAMYAASTAYGLSKGKEKKKST